MRIWIIATALAGSLLFGCSAADSGEAIVHADAGAIDDATPGVDAPGDTATSAEASEDAAAMDDADAVADGGVTEVDAGDGGCFLNSGVYGECITTESCAALGDYTSTPGFCPGPADIECCSVTPNVDDNPPVPTGWELMQQVNVTPAMTAWAVDILNDPTMYPMFSTAMQTFGTLMVLARVEWHSPDFQNSVIHRGVTLYQPI